MLSLVVAPQIGGPSNDKACAAKLLRDGQGPVILFKQHRKLVPHHSPAATIITAAAVAGRRVGGDYLGAHQQFATPVAHRRFPGTAVVVFGVADVVHVAQLAVVQLPHGRAVLRVGDHIVPACGWRSGVRSGERVTNNKQVSQDGMYVCMDGWMDACVESVSYTHLTLPTIYSV